MKTKQQSHLTLKKSVTAVMVAFMVTTGMTMAMADVDTGLSIGIQATAAGTDAFAAGSRSQADANDATAVGFHAVANTVNSVALGSGSVAGIVHKGTTASQTSIVDASGNKTTFTYAGTPTDANSLVSIGSAGFERQLQNVAAGDISATSTDAVNGSQLSATNTNVANLQTAVDNMRFTTDPNYTGVLSVAGNTGSDKLALGNKLKIVGSAAVTGKTYSTANVTTEESQATDGTSTITVKMSETPSFTSITAGTGTNQVVLDNTGVKVGTKTYITGSGINANSQKITNVANGDVTATSKDAVNGAQLYGTVRYDSASKALVTLGDGTHSTIIDKVAPGILSTTSLQAVNGTQLNQTNTDVANLQTAVSKLTTTTDAGYTGVLTFSGNTGIDKVALGQKVNIIGSAAAAGTTYSANNLTTEEKQATDGTSTITIKMSETPSFTGITAGTGANQVVLDNAGVKVGTKTYITGSGINANSQKITNVADGDVTAASKDAVNGSQLYNAIGTTSTIDPTGGGSTTGGGSVVNNINNLYKLVNAGWEADVNGTKLKAVTPTSNKLNFKAGTNVTISGSGDDITISATSQSASGSDPSAVHYNASGSTVDKTKITLGDGTNSTVVDKVAAGVLSSTSLQAVNGSQLNQTNTDVANLQTTVNNLTTTTGTNYTGVLSVAGNTGEDKVALGKKVKIVGQAAAAGTTYSTENLTTEEAQDADGTGTITVKMSTTPVFTGLKAGTGANQVVLDSNGVNVGTKTYITGNGFNANSQKITNVADGTLSATSKDAVNGSQLNDVNTSVTNLQTTINKLTTTTSTDYTGVLSFAGNDGEDKVTLGKKVKILGNTSAAGVTYSSDNLTTKEEKDPDDNSVITIEMSETPSFNSVTAGTGANKIVLDDNGVKVGTKTYITGSGINANSQKITNVADGDVTAASKDAVNGSQLYNAIGTTSTIDPTGGGSTTGGGSVVNNINNLYKLVNAGWEADVNGTKLKAVTPTSNKLNFKAGTNVTISGSGDDITISATGQGTGGSDPSAVHYDVSGSTVDKTKITLGDGTNGTVIDKVADGALSSTSLQAVNGSQLNKTNTDVTNLQTKVDNLTTTTGTNYTGVLSIAGDTGTDKVALGKKISIVGSAAAAGKSYSADNLTTEETLGADGNSIVTVKMSTTPTITGLTVSAGANQVVLDSNGVKVGGNTYITGSGLNANSQKITNVMAGDLNTTSKDAVNGSQLYAVSNDITNLKTTINNLTSSGGTSSGVLSFGGNSGEDKVAMGKSVKIMGSTADANKTYSINNLTTEEAKDSNGNSTVTVKMSTTPFFTSVTTGMGATQIVLNNTGIAVGNKTYISSTGMNANSQKITNVADGDVTAASKDAVNGSQLYNAIGTTSTIDPTGGGSTTGGGSVVNNINNLYKLVNAGWEADVNGTKLKAVTPTSNKLNFKAGTNVTISGSGDDITINAAVQGTGGSDSSAVHYDVSGGAVDKTRITLGDGTNGTVIDKVADGALSSTSLQAVNGSQLNQTNTDLADLQNKAVHYDLNSDQSVNTSKITFSGTSGTVLANVADGTLSTSSKEAVNGSQLNKTNTDVTNLQTTVSNLTTTTGTNYTGVLSFAGNTGEDKVALGKKVKIVGNTAATGTTYGTDNLTTTEAQDADGSSTITVKMSTTPVFTSLTAGTGANQVVLGSNGVTVGTKAYIDSNGLNANSQKITNVADGTLSATSKDAVNASQLNDTNTNVTGLQTTVNNLTTTTGAGYTGVLSFAGNTGTDKVALGKKVDIIGSTAAAGVTYSSNNLTTEEAKDADDNSVITLKMSETPSFTSVTAGTGANQITLDNTGVKVGANIYITKEGLNANDQKIDQVADGALTSASKEAVNGSQIQAITSKYHEYFTRISTFNVGVSKYGITWNPITDDDSNASVHKTTQTSNTIVNRTGTDALRFGIDATDYGDNSTVFGNTAHADVDNTVALGYGSVSAAAHMGTTAQDLTFGSMTATYAGLASAANGTVSFGSPGKERQLQNVAAGDVTATSTDAINGSQLYATNTNVATLQEELDKISSTAADTSSTNSASSKSKIALRALAATPAVTDSNASNQAGVLQSPNVLNSNDIAGVFEFHANVGTAQSVLSKKVSFLGSAPVSGVVYSTDNLTTEVTQTALGEDSTFTFKMSTTPKFTSVDVGDTVAVSATGIDMGNQKIINLLAGTNDSDAVTVAQLNNAVAGFTAGNSKFVAGKNITLGTSTVSGVTDYTVGLKDAVTLGTTGSAQAVTIDGTAGKISSGSVSINGGTDNTVTGLSNTTWDPANIVSGRAATEDQLQALSTETKSLVTSDTTAVHYDSTTKDTITLKGTDGTKLTNLQDGEISATSTDAVTGKQMYAATEVMNSLNNGLGELSERVDKVGAGAAALASLHPLDYDPENKFDVAAGVGHYSGQSAAALGAFYRPNENTMVNFGTEIGGGENMWNLGMTFKIGSGGVAATTSRTAMAKKIVGLESDNKSMKQQIRELQEQNAKIAAQLEALLQTKNK